MSSPNPRLSVVWRSMEQEVWICHHVLLGYGLLETHERSLKVEYHRKPHYVRIYLGSGGELV